LDVIGVGTQTGQAQHWWWDGRWGGPEPLLIFAVTVPPPGVLFASADWRKSGNLDVFGVSNVVLGASDQSRGLLHWWWDNTWHWDQNFPGVNGVRLASLCARAWEPDHFDVFAIGEDPDNALGHFWWNPDGWHGLHWLGGTLAPGSSPSAVTWGPGRLDVFGVDANTYALQHWWWPQAGGGWQGPESLGGALMPTFSTSAVSWESGRLDVFGIDVGNRDLQHWWWPAD
jgi:hypothetical protein